MAARRSSPPEEVTERELVITRVFDAPRPLVFKAWIEPERIKEWWGPRGFTTLSCEIDLRPGGDIATAADRQPAAAVDDRERPDPTPLADVGLADEPGVRVVRIVGQMMPIGRRHRVASWPMLAMSARARTTVSCSASVICGNSGKVTARRATSTVLGNSSSAMP